MSETATTPAAIETAAPELNQAQVSEQPSGEPPKQEAFKPIKLKLKLDKKEEEMEFDYDKLTRTVQKGIVADRRFEEAARKEQEVRKLALELQDKYSRLTDKQARKMALQELGVDPVQLAEELMTEYLEEQSLTGEQRKIKELEMFKQQKEREEQELLEKFRAQQEEQEMQTYYKQVDEQITQALQAEGINKNLETVERILQYLRAAQRNGVEITVPEIVQRLQNDGKAFLKSFVDGKKAEQLAELLGEDTLKEINNYFLKKRTGGTKAAISIAPRQSKQAPVDPYLFFKNLGR